MKFSRTLLSAAVATSAMAFGASANAALTLAAPPLECTLSILDPAYTECGGSFAGNNSEQESDVIAYISSTWNLDVTSLGQSDDAGGFGPFTSDPKTTTGTLTFDTPMDGPFVLSLKAGNQFSLFYYDGIGAAISSIDYSTLGVNVNKNGVPNGLSHATLYADPVTAVPEPETYALMLAGLGVVGFVARRRKQQA